MLTEQTLYFTIIICYSEGMSEFNFVETPNSSKKVIDTITLTGNDYLSFPTFFMQKNELKKEGSDLYLKLYFDKGNQAIAIQFMKEKREGLYKANQSDKYGATCKIRAFLLKNGIDSNVYAAKYQYKKYEASSIGLDGEDVYVLSLKPAREGGLEM